MFKYSVREIVKAVNGKLIKGNQNEILTGVSTDTRNLSDEDIFVALKGPNFDAHNILNKPKKNIKAVIVEKDIEINYPFIIKVDNTVKALQEMAKFHRNNHSDVKIIGITGSSGKTSTKDILFSILKEKFKVKKSKGNLNNHIGVPLTLFRLEGNEDIFIVEMGMSNFGEIKLLSEIAKPQIGLITNIGRAHIEFFDSVKDIARAKGELLVCLGENNLAVLNYDNDYTDILNNFVKEETKVQYFGFNKKADFYINQYNYLDDGMEFELINKDYSYKFKTNLYGKHNLYNIIAAITVARNLNLEWDLIKNGLKKIELTGLRSEMKDINGIKFINDCYNANPSSMKNAINMLKNISGNKKIAVLGDMLELGKIKQKAHKEIGSYIAKSGIDYLITTGVLGKYISESAIQSEMDKNMVKHFKNKEEIPEFLDEITDTNDVVLLKASRGMQMESIYQEFKKDKD
ncbi:MAG: UDP-N-acetylmuramoyl-tripeptide--D-alanyl-D-alanine ligase [Halanaerobiales bacterium]|nr:UDP-N-acetylmuramoyl-tripeptide--D-alanyl-D-alanine ligase [Halanaerobiales bacterium]